MDFRVMTGEEALEYWRAEAIRRDASDNHGFNSFEDSEVTTIVSSYKRVFGFDKAKKFIERCQETQRIIGSKNITFNPSVVKALANAEELSGGA